MKKLIESFYNIKPLSFLKLSDKAYRIKTENKDYVLKYIDKVNIDIIIEKLKLLNIDSFLFPLPNINGEYISIYQDSYFVIYEWLSEEKVILKDLKLKFRGSSNQRLIDVKNSLLKKEVILIDK